MKSSPILFSGPMVRAILEGRKTQTRRVIRPQPKDPEEALLRGIGFSGTNSPKCPYETGDQLWVKETWCRKMDDGVFVYNREGNLDSSCCYYRADGEYVYKDDGDGGIEYRKDGRTWASPWSPSIHMPRWASRITLEITGVRVERVQDISEQDAAREGLETVYEDGDRCSIGFGAWKNYGFQTAHPRKGEAVVPEKHQIVGFQDATRSFRSLWDSLNAKRGFSWDSNPWVWVVQFKRI